MSSRMGARGFTLIEVVVTMLVFAVASVALAGFYVGAARLGESSRNLSRALNDVRAVAEAIRDASASGLATVTATNWTNWAAQNGLTGLPNEAVTVTYVNPGADPLQATVQVSWQEAGRARSASVDTLVTRR